jgi:hypothetical protein
MSQCDFPAAILKGVVEKDDGTAYFGSLGAFTYYENQAIDRGWVTRGPQYRMSATPKGHKVYREAKLDMLPHKGRAYMWNWSDIDLAPFLDKKE